MEDIIARWKKFTENKSVWTAKLDTAEFNLYIPKWRIPLPIPEEILIKIYYPLEDKRGKNSITKTDIQLHPELKRNKICTDVHRVRSHTNTIRFDPKGNSNNWEIGSPYIPKSLLEDEDVDELSLEIEWIGLNDLKKSGDSNEIVEIKKIMSIGESDTVEFKSSVQDKSRNIRNTTQDLVREFELRIRYFIKNQLEIFYGDDWWNLGVSLNIRESAEKRKRNKQIIEPRRTYDIIDFLNFNDYKSIISQTKNWNKIFNTFFREKYLIQSPLDKISDIRNDLAHHRFKDKDFEKCKTYIEDISKYLPDS